jgi:cellulose synthase/poly-beta-1,6-N-acetylglucosamine synthase-like glycosyltransferase
MHENSEMRDKVSIIIPFVEFDSYIFECVINILNIDYNEFEVILLPDIKINLPLELRNERIKVIETGDKNISSKRNIGIQNSSGDLFAFIDSDAYPTKHWLKQAVETFSKDPDIWAVGGPNVTPPDDNLYEKCVGNSLKSFLVSGGKSFRKKTTKSRYCTDLPSCNLILKKQAMEELEGFNENLFTGEDIDLCKRLIKKGKKIFFNKNAVIYHHNRPLFKPFILQRITYGLSVIKLLKEDISWHTLSLFAPMIFIVFLVVGSILSFISHKFRMIYILIITIYLLIMIFEAVRYSDHKREILFTFISLIIGNISPGIGSLAALLKLKVDIKKIYSGRYQAKNVS